MLEEVKKIKLEELSKQESKYDKEKNLISQKTEELQNKLWSLQYEQSNGITIRGEFSFLEKLITKRSEYKKFKAQSKRFSELPRLISELEIELDKEMKRTNEELDTLGISQKLQEIGQKISLIENAKTLYELGLTPMDAIELLKNNGIQPILSESDKGLFLHPRDYSSKSALIGVHKTKYPPTENMIKSSKDSNVEYKKSVTINGIEYEYSFKAGRDTVHMAMNDEVSSHAFGSWEDCQYAILIPFDDIPNEKIGRAAPMDTFTRGSIELSENTWILCPKDEAYRLKAFNPKVHVLGYEGKSVQGFSQPFLTQLGYRPEEVGMWSWSDTESAHQFDELMEKEKIKTGAHSYTYFHEDELMLEDINKAVSLMKLLRDNHLITKPEDIENIMKQLEKQNQSFGHILSGLGEKSQFEDNIEPQQIKGNHRQADIFLEELKKSGFNISQAYQNVIKKLCEASIYGCNANNRNMIFDIPKEALEEQSTIEALQTVLVYGNSSEKELAFDKFISTAIGDAILHSQERDLSKEDTQCTR